MRDGRSEEEIAGCLRERTVNFGLSANALALAQNIERSIAGDQLSAMQTWQRIATRFRIVTANGESLGEYKSVNGRTFAVGDPLDFMHGPCRVLAVENDDDPQITARLRVG